jgi:hypothetical protein
MHNNEAANRRLTLDFESESSPELFLRRHIAWTRRKSVINDGIVAQHAIIINLCYSDL